MVPDLDAVRVDHHAGFRIDALGPEARPEVGRHDADLQDAVRAIEQLTDRRVAQRPEVDARVLRVTPGECGLAQQVGDHGQPEPLGQAYDRWRQAMTAGDDAHVESRPPRRREHRLDLGHSLVERAGQGLARLGRALGAPTAPTDRRPAPSPDPAGSPGNRAASTRPRGAGPGRSSREPTRGRRGPPR